MTEEAGKLAQEIVACGMKAYQGQGGVCAGVAQNLPTPTAGSYHLPDPWNGNLETARLLIVGVNPGLDPREDYPSLGDEEWMKDGQLDHGKICSFFENRFWTGGGEGPVHSVKVNEGGESFDIPRRDGSSANRYRGYWKYAADIAKFLLGDDAKIGTDYALTELVHCKTNHVGQIPTPCYEVCFKRYFGRILALASHLETVVIVGGWARYLCKQYWAGSMTLEGEPISADQVKDHMYEKLTLHLGDRSVALYFADHNNGRGAHRGSVSRFRKAVASK